MLAWTGTPTVSVGDCMSQSLSPRPLETAIDLVGSIGGTAVTPDQVDDHAMVLKVRHVSSSEFTRVVQSCSVTHQSDSPPSMTTFVPVTKPEDGEAK